MKQEKRTKRGVDKWQERGKGGMKENGRMESIYTQKIARNTKVSGKLNEGTKESMRMGIKMERTKEVKYWGSGRQKRRKETCRLVKMEST